MRRRGRERWRKCRLNVKAINLNWVRGGRGRKKLDEEFIGEERDKNAFAFVRFQGDAVRGETSSRLLINYLVFSSRWSCFHAWPYEYYWMLVYTRILTSLTVVGYFSSCFTCTFCISLSELEGLQQKIQNEFVIFGFPIDTILRLWLVNGNFFGIKLKLMNRFIRKLIIQSSNDFSQCFEHSKACQRTFPFKLEHLTSLNEEKALAVNISKCESLLRSNLQHDGEPN